ncbi:DUF916 and DUF3324 domain-containing protein [Lactiplantibacillus pentosus]|jgi:membrane-associated HD superfamily phosphohydrolase|nr:DUF916 and DUF3324 domain-containing protein [Lactiplantibacillus pentosus]USJ85815.1 DUF916 and DUF3324 domain-containing protein [Lactiplantibacillus pentosus]
MSVGKRLRALLATALVSVMSLFMGGMAQSAKADSAVGFEISPVRSSSQVDSNVSYFDLKLKPKQTQTIAVKVHNTSNAPITINVGISKATTNINGVVAYQRATENKSADLPYDLAKLVTTDQSEVKLDKGQVKAVKFQIKMPAKSYDGILAGGLTFLKKATAAETKKAVAVNNQYAYTEAVILHGDRDLTTNHLTMNKITVKQLNGRNVINFPLVNHTAAYLNKVQTKIKIYHRGGQKVVYHQNLTNGQMAPSSIYKLPVRTGQNALKAGKYTAVVKVQSKKQHWQFKQNFVITQGEATNLNQTAVLKQGPNWWLYIGIGLLILLLIILLIWYIRRKQKKIKELEKQLNDKRQS